MKKLCSILFFGIFAMAQFGKVASYVYCKWETRAQVQCDCEKAFAYDDHQKDHQVAAINPPTKFEDPVVLYSVYSAFNPTLLKKTFSPRASERVPEGFPLASFHPPSLI